MMAFKKILYRPLHCRALRKSKIEILDFSQIDPSTITEFTRTTTATTPRTLHKQFTAFFTSDNLM